MNSEVEAAVAALVPDAERTGDDTEDLVQAAREALRRRRENTRLGGAVLKALNESMSWRNIEDATGIAVTTARRWAEPES